MENSFGHEKKPGGNRRAWIGSEVMVLVDAGEESVMPDLAGG
jgi:hypothetical protein